MWNSEKIPFEYIAIIKLSNDKIAFAMKNVCLFVYNCFFLLKITNEIVFLSYLKFNIILTSVTMVKKIFKTKLTNKSKYNINKLAREVDEYKYLLETINFNKENEFEKKKSKSKKIQNEKKLKNEIKCKKKKRKEETIIKENNIKEEID
jgi:hypothetical protein